MPVPVTIRAAPGARRLILAKHLPAALGAALLYHVLLGALAPLFLGFVLWLALTSVVSRERGDGTARGSLVDWLGLTVAVPVLLGVLVVPLRAAIQIVLPRLEAQGAIVPELVRAVLVQRWVDAFLGVAGLAMALVALLRLATTWAKLSRVTDLPTSRARSAAIGLVELQGTARAAPAERGAPALTTRGPRVDWDEIFPPGTLLYKGAARPIRGEKSSCEFARPFFLEDATGRILIDPRGAQFGGFNTLYAFGEPPARLALSKAHLLDGDPVYVLGVAGPRAPASPLAVDSDRLVVSAGRPFPPAHPALGWLAGALRRRDVFLVSDRPEAEVRYALGWTMLQTVAFELVLLVASAWLLLTGVLAPG